MAVKIYMLAIVDYWKAGLIGVGYGWASLYRLANEKGILGEFGWYSGQAMIYEAFKRRHRTQKSYGSSYDCLICTVNRLWFRFVHLHMSKLVRNDAVAQTRSLIS